MNPNNQDIIPRLTRAQKKAEHRQRRKDRRRTFWKGLIPMIILNLLLAWLSHSELLEKIRKLLEELRKPPPPPPPEPDPVPVSVPPGPALVLEGRTAGGAIRAPFFWEQGKNVYVYHGSPTGVVVWELTDCQALRDISRGSLHGCLDSRLALEPGDELVAAKPR